MSTSNLTSIASAQPVHNPALPRVPITFDGVEYHLEYSFNAIAIAEEKVGINLFGAFDFTQLTVTKFRAMLFSSLVKNHPDMTLERAGDFIRASNLADITVAMIKAWHGSMPEVVTVKDDATEGNENTESEK
jgi:hypothetical protein